MLSDMNIEEALEADENYDGIGSTPSEWADRKHLPLGAVLMRAERPFRMLGIRDPKQQQLGRGAFGRAFKIDVHGQPTVLKLRPDHKLVYLRAWDDPADRLKGMRKFLGELAKLAA